MGGNTMEEDWELASASSGARNLVLVGRTGNGKSATGNSILGRKVFKSKFSTIGVTSTCELQSVESVDGQIINVVDTPGLFDLSTASESVGKEIVRCITLAEEGIHAVLLVFSVRNRLSQEEESALRNLQSLFGSKIIEYMIVVFTGGDDLEDNGETLEDFLAQGWPEFLKEILEACNNRVVLFDNKTNDERKKAQQVEKLLSLVDSVVEQNGGKPYTDELFNELKQGAMKLRDQQREIESSRGYSEEQLLKLKKQMEMSYEEQVNRLSKTVETRLRETTKWMEQRLEVEQAARKKAEEMAKEVQKKSMDEIERLRGNLENARRETEALRNEARQRCHIL